MQHTEWPNIGSICNTEMAQFATRKDIQTTLKFSGWGQGGGDSGGGVGVRGIRGVRVGDCVHTHSSYISSPLGFWVGTGGWGQWGGAKVRAIRGVRFGDCVHTHSSYVRVGGDNWGVRGENCYRGDGFAVSALDFNTTAGSKLSFYADNSIQERLHSCGVPCVNNMCQTVRSSGRLLIMIIII